MTGLCIENDEITDRRSEKMLYMIISDKDNGEKIEKLYYKYRNLMYKVSYDILQDKHLAEDAISESFERILKNLHKIDEIDCTKTKNFMVIICRNISINIYNSRKNGMDCELNDDNLNDASVTDPADIVVSKENIKRMSEIISNLDNKYKDVFILKRVYDIPNEEIAKMLDVKEETVRKRLQRAKGLILKEYREEEKK